MKNDILDEHEIEPQAHVWEFDSLGWMLLAKFFALLGIAHGFQYFLDIIFDLIEYAKRSHNHF